MKRDSHVSTHLAALLIAGCLGACTGSEDDGATVAKGNVDQGGGTLSSKDGDVILSVPPGAFEATRAVVISKPDVEDLPAGVIAGTVVDLGIDVEEPSFAKPVELALGYRKEDLPDTDSPWLRVVQILPDGSLGHTQFLRHDREAGQVKALLAHFSRYALADLEVAQASFESSAERANQVDLLVMVDDSGSMLGEQQNLARNFPRLAAKLDAAGLDYRVGIVSPNLGAGDYTYITTCETPGGLQGKLQVKSQCGPIEQPWIEKHGEQSNVPDGDVTAAFSCIANLGPDGCGFEQPLEAIYKALDSAVNPGFLRDDAALALLVITDEDDCSARNPKIFDTKDFSLGPSNWRCFEQAVRCEGIDPSNVRDPGVRSGCQPREDGFLHPVSRYVERLRQLKPEGKVLVSLIAGPTDPISVELRDGLGPSGEAAANLVPSCTAGNTRDDKTEAFPAIRLRAFADAFGADRSSFTSICAQDTSPALDRLGDLVARSDRLSWCLPYDPEDTNSITDALEADCVVKAGTLGQLPACTADDSNPCYRVTKNADCAASTSQLELENASPEDLGENEVELTCLVP